MVVGVGVDVAVGLGVGVRVAPIKGISLEKPQLTRGSVHKISIKLD